MRVQSFFRAIPVCIEKMLMGKWPVVRLNQSHTASDFSRTTPDKKSISTLTNQRDNKLDKYFLNFDSLSVARHCCCCIWGIWEMKKYRYFTSSSPVPDALIHTKSHNKSLCIQPADKNASSSALSGIRKIFEENNRWKFVLNQNIILLQTSIDQA